MFVLLDDTTFWNEQNMSPLHWGPVRRAGLLHAPCGDPVVLTHSSFLVVYCLVYYIFWLEVPKIKQGLGHSLACQRVFRDTRRYGRIWKARVCGIGVGGLSLVEEAELGIICMSVVCCLYQLCLLLLWEGMHLFILGKSLRVISWLYP